MLPEDVDASQVRMPYQGKQVDAGNGHGTGFFTEGNLTAVLMGERVTRYYNQETAREAESRLSSAANRMTASHATVFPAMSYLSQIQTLRVWHPKGPGRMEVWAWVLVDREAPADVKEAYRLATLRTFGPGGMLEQEDGENWSQCAAASRGWVSRHRPNNLQMGLRDEGTDGEYPGRVSHVFSEMNGRAFYRRWVELLTADRTARRSSETAPREARHAS
jgi:hypothetical protein